MFGNVFGDVHRTCVVHHPSTEHVHHMLLIGADVGTGMRVALQTDR
jgi:hypothetical protein